MKQNVSEGDPIDQRVAELFAADFEASGVHLAEDEVFLSFVSNFLIENFTHFLR